MRSWNRMRKYGFANSSSGHAFELYVVRRFETVFEEKACRCCCHKGGCYAGFDPLGLFAKVPL